MDKYKFWVIALVIASLLLIPMGGLDLDIGKLGSRSTIGEVLTIGLVEGVYAAAPDYEVDGTADDVQAQQALDDLPSTGGKIIFYAGAYNFTATVSRAINNVTIEGSGRGTYFTYDASNAIFSVGSQSGWIFRDFGTDAGGITLASGSDYRLENVLAGSSDYNYVRTATFVVAASDSATESKSQADFVGDGTADNVQIQAAIDACSAAGGGTVVFLEGTYDIAATIDLKNFVSLQGQGRWATILSPSADIWIMATTGATGPGWGDSISYLDISGFHFGDGAWGNVTADGIDLSWGQNIKIYDNQFTQLKGVCVKFLEAVRNELYDNDFQDCGSVSGSDAVVHIMGDGSDAKHSDDIRIFNNDFLMNEYMTIRTTWNQAHIWICNNYFENDDVSPTATYHIGSTDASSMARSWIIDNLFFFVADTHIYMGGWTTGNRIIGNFFEGGIQAYVTDEFGNNEAHRREVITNNEFLDQTGQALQLALPYYSTVTDNVFKGPVDNYNFYPTNGLGWVFTGNTIEQGYGINNDNNPTAIIRDNYGYATENSGSATLINGTTSIAVSHGLDVTPGVGDIVGTPIENWGSMTEFWLGNYTSSQFEFIADQDPGEDVDFAWSADVY